MAIRSYVECWYNPGCGGFALGCPSPINDEEQTRTAL